MGERLVVWQTPLDKRWVHCVQYAHEYRTIYIRGCRRLGDLRRNIWRGCAGSGIAGLRVQQGGFILPFLRSKLLGYSSSLPYRVMYIVYHKLKEMGIELPDSYRAWE